MQLGDSTASPDEGGLKCMSNELFEPLGDPPPGLAAVSYAASTLWGQGVRDKVATLMPKSVEVGHLDVAAALDFGGFVLKATKQLEDELLAAQEQTNVAQKRADEAEEARAQTHVEVERLRSENHSLKSENHSLQSRYHAVLKAASELVRVLASAHPTLGEALTQRSADSAADYSYCSKTPSSSSTSSTTSLLRLDASARIDAVESTLSQRVSALQNELVKNGLPYLMNDPQKCADSSGEEGLTERGSVADGDKDVFTTPLTRTDRLQTECSAGVQNTVALEGSPTGLTELIGAHHV